MNTENTFGTVTSKGLQIGSDYSLQERSRKLKDDKRNSSLCVCSRSEERVEGL